MKVKHLMAKNIKRFTDLEIRSIPESTKLVLVVGPNGSGKSSLFDCFYRWYKKTTGFGLDQDMTYYQKEQGVAFDNQNAVQVDFYGSSPISKKSMYFRSAYRNDPDFSVSSFTKVGAPSENLKFDKLIDNDQAVSGNYQRLIHNTMEKLYDTAYDAVSVLDLRIELIGKIRQSMQNVFSDLRLNNIGDPLSDGTFKFEKGAVKSFLYKNLSGGEKAAFDLILDLVIKLDDYEDTVFFIDEPETHMHTSLQASLIREIYSVLPEKSQLWVNTHSFGIMQEAREIEGANPGTVAILDFADRDFDTPTVLTPSRMDKVLWEKFLSVSFGDFSRMVSPGKVFICEGDYTGVRRKDFDAEIYSRIFQVKYPDAVFLSGGACNDIVKDDHPVYLALKALLKSSAILRIVDRDDYSPADVAAFNAKGIRVLTDRNLESYLFSDEVLRAFVESIDPTKWALVQAIKQNALSRSISRGNAPDDIKSASGEIYVETKKLMALTKCGNNADAFMRDILSAFVLPGTNTFSTLERDIF
ncbi:MAG: AAA family ATPase [Spirochaetes bacterium]|nr:AAA family ATPase [Spirochaetota bacterium]